MPSDAIVLGPDGSFSFGDIGTSPQPSYPVRLRSSIATCDQGPRRESAGQCRASSGGRWGKEADACPGFRGGLIGRVNKCSIPSKLFCCCFAKSCVGTPANIIARLNAAIVEALADPAVSRAS